MSTNTRLTRTATTIPVRTVREVVINIRFGGFGLSKEAWHQLATRKDMLLVEEGGDGFTYCHLEDAAGNKLGEYDLKRDDLDLVATVKDLGARADGGLRGAEGGGDPAGRGVGRGRVRRQ